jgi:hypothetical protein
MKQLDKLNFESNKLVAFYIGGKIEGINVEAHDVRFLIGKSREEFTTKIKESWIGTQKSLHIDSFIILDSIDSYNIEICENKVESDISKKLFFINLGYYNANNFGEHHFMKFIIADSKVEAKKLAREQFLESVDILHTDDLYDIDECILIDSINNQFIQIKPSKQGETQTIENGWMRLSK